MKVSNRITLVAFVIVFFAAGCSNAASNMDKLVPFEKQLFIQQANETVKPDPKSNTLTIWAPDNFLTDQIAVFQAKFPHVQVRVVNVGHDEMMTRYMEAMNEQKPPDIILINDVHVGNFSGIDGFVNLLEMEASDHRFFERMPAGLMNNFKTFHEDKLFAMPILSFPYVTFYRADLFEKAGIPSEPHALGEYLNDPGNWLQLAIERKSEGQYIVESDQSVLFILNRLTHYFDEQLEYVLAQGAAKSALDMAVQVKDLAPQVNIWDASGQEALRDGKLIMLYAPSYVHYNLKEWVPDQAGKWRITTLPFGLQGVDKAAGLSLAISSHSSNIDLAWEFVKIAAEGLTYMYENDLVDPFYGDQDLNAVFREVLEADFPGRPTPLDHYASELWELYLYKLMMGAPLTEPFIAKIEDEIMERIRIEKRTLLNLLQ